MMIPEIKLKQYVFLPKSLNMSVGKAASQVAHATYLALSTQLLKQLKSREGPGKLREEWEENGLCVIVLEAKDPEHLNNIAKYMDQWEIPNHLYIDEGLTEVLPMTPTALATGIVPEDKFWMFDQFKLFGDKTIAQDMIDEFKPASIKNYKITVKKPISFGPYEYNFEWGQAPQHDLSYGSFLERMFDIQMDGCKYD